MSSISLALPDDSLAASRPTILRRADEPVAQAAHPVRDHRLPVRPAPADHHPAAGLLAGGALLPAGAALPECQVFKIEQNTFNFELPLSSTSELYVHIRTACFSLQSSY